MNNSAGFTAIGIGGIGFGILLLYSAYKNQSLFGKGGIIPNLIDTGKLGKAAGKKAGETFNFPQPGREPAAKPPGYGGFWEDV